MGNILATISFIRTEDGGRNGPLPSGRIGYILEVSGQSFSCWLLNPKGIPVEPGGAAQLEMVLAAPELALPLLKEGRRFELKDHRKVATGIIDKILV